MPLALMAEAAAGEVRYSMNAFAAAASFVSVATAYARESTSTWTHGFDLLADVLYPIKSLLCYSNSVPSFPEAL